MWDILKIIAQWPLWNFLSVVLVVFVTQRVIAARERRKKISETQLEMYMATVAPLFDFYDAALDPDKVENKAKLQRDLLEMAARFSIMGSNSIMETFCNYSHAVLEHVRTNQPADEPTIRRLASNVTCAMCCDIHNETYRDTDVQLTNRSTGAAVGRGI